MSLPEKLLRSKAMKSGHTHVFLVECRDAEGRLKWQECVPNLVTNEGLNDLLNVYYKGATAPSGFFIGLTNASPTFAPGDTMSSHPGWTENTNYSQTSRPACSFGTVSNQSVSNSASPATFTISAATTIGGAFLTTNNTKGGTSGKLIGGAAFSTNRSLVANDTLTITVTASASSL